MCFVWISEPTAIISLYSINWLVCITETECVYCAVRTGCLNVIWVICFIWIWEQTAIIYLHSINWLIFIIETEGVYCAVRLNILYITEENFRFPKRVTLLRLLFVLVSLRLSGFKPCPIHVRYVLGKVAMGQTFFQVLLSVSNHHCSILLFTLILLVCIRGTTGRGLGNSKQRNDLSTCENIGEKSASVLFIVRLQKVALADTRQCFACLS